MDCQLFERQALRGIDGLLTDHEQEDLQKHAAACSNCAALLQELSALDSMLRAQLKATEPPQDFAAGVMAALPAPYAKPIIPLTLRQRPWLRWGSAAAAAVLLVAAGLFGLLPADNEPGQVIAPAKPSLVAENPQSDPIQAVETQPVTTQPKEIITANNMEDDPLSEQPDSPDPANGEKIETEADPANENNQPIQAGNPSYGSSVDLPKPAYETQAGGVLILTMLASYDDCDAVLPSLNAEGVVEYYVKYKGLTQRWTRTLASEDAPEYQEQVKYLPSLSDITGSMDESAVAGYPYVSAVSPDGRIMAVNRGGEKHGVWLYEDFSVLNSADEQETGQEISGSLGGGKVLSWSPDGNKLLYSDATGRLYVYYLYLPEPYSLPLYPDGIITSACWAQDSKLVVFAGKAAKNERSSIYAIEIP